VTTSTRRGRRRPARVGLARAGGFLCAPARAFPTERDAVPAQLNHPMRTVVVPAAVAAVMHAGVGRSSWQERAVCGHTADPEAWWPRKGDPPPPEVVEMCNRCPVRQDCLWHALDHGEEEGVWGGMSEDDRAALKKKLQWPRRGI
jgi:WhiB family transcriptional regulator, redox-sensing transcriptional regulator